LRFSTPNKPIRNERGLTRTNTDVPNKTSFGFYPKPEIVHRKYGEHIGPVLNANMD